MRFAVILALSLAALPACKKDKTEQQTPAPRETEPAQPPKSGAAALSAEAIGKAAGTEATEKDGVVRIGWSRGDVKVAVDGAPFPAPAGLGSWAAFAADGDGARVMGDTVVFEDEINPALDAAFAGGLEVTAIHNHFIFDDPPVFFMHIGGAGDAARLAAAVKGMWDAIKAVRAKAKTPVRRSGREAPKPGELDAAALEAILGQKLAEKPGGVLKVVFGRDARMGDLEFDGSMGLTTWAAFSGSDARASIDGDFAMTAAEVQPVLRALRAAGIDVVALHNHMIGESPAYYFTHFWAIGPAAELAKGFKSALDAQKAATK